MFVIESWEVPEYHSARVYSPITQYSFTVDTNGTVTRIIVGIVHRDRHDTSFPKEDVIDHIGKILGTLQSSHDDKEIIYCLPL